MENSWKIKKELTFTNICADISKLGKDYHILLSGGEQPHVGCTVLAIPRPSLDGSGKISSTASVMNVTGHKDEKVCRYLAERVAAEKNAVVVCTGGIHIDGITKEQIAEIEEKVREIVYTFEGNAIHYIDGKAHRAEPGKLFVTNSESIHKVISDEATLGMPGVIAVVLLVNIEFIRRLVPDINQMYFLPEADVDKNRVDMLMKEFAKYAGENKKLEEYENLKLMAMMYELMYLLCRDDLVIKETVLPINNQKNLERLRGIMQYVDIYKGKIILSTRCMHFEKRI